MPTERLPDFTAAPCRHPCHNPPRHQVRRPGTYRYTCPRCQTEQTFTVGGSTLAPPPRR